MIARSTLGGLLLTVALALGVAPAASAATTCTFTVDGAVMTLDGDCTTDATILVPDGMTLDGQGHSITAVDPPAGHFRGAVIANGGTRAGVEHVVVTVAGLANVCDGGTDRLRGILFEGGSGVIAHTRVVGIHQGPSGCQEGNAIEVRNAPYDGTHPNPIQVEIFNNRIDAYQKTGIVANGDVEVTIHENHVGASATEPWLAANGIQLGFGARGWVGNNSVDGNQWCGGSNYAATAILLYQAAPDSEVSQNTVRGNSDVGIYVLADGVTLDNNRIFDEGADCNPFGYDVGLGDYGTGNAVTNNKARGFATPYDGVAPGAGRGRNKTIPAPQD